MCRVEFLDRVIPGLRRLPVQAVDEIVTHGGKRPGAGRKPKRARPDQRHRTRPEHDPRHPVHVTIRVVGSAADLRRKDIWDRFHPLISVREVPGR
jgi:hypothetical protein